MHVLIRKKSSFSVLRNTPAILTLLVFIVLSYMYLKYEYLWLLLLLFLSFICLIWYCEKAFGHPHPLSNEIKNADLPIAKNVIKDLLSRAKRDVLIVSGTLSSNIWNSEEVLKGFNHIKPDLEKIRIFITKDLDRSSLNLFNILRCFNVEIYKICEGMDIKHFIVVDSMHVRLEVKHELKETKRKAIVRFNSQYLAGKVENYFFEEIKSKEVKKISIDNLTTIQNTGIDDPAYGQIINKIRDENN